MNPKDKSTSRLVRWSYPLLCSGALVGFLIVKLGPLSITATAWTVSYLILTWWSFYRAGRDAEFYKWCDDIRASGTLPELITRLKDRKGPVTRFIIHKINEWIPAAKEDRDAKS